MIAWRLLAAASAVVLLASAVPAAADFQEGVAALRVGQYAVALDAWQKSAEAGDAKSQYGMGYLYQFGLGIEPDQAQAKAWYEKAAAQNEPNALYALGLMYESGRVGKRDRAKALDLYRKAAATGRSPDAEYAIGRIHFRGQGVPRDEKMGLNWLLQAAHDGQPGAQYMLGEAYEVGVAGVVRQDRIAAYYWYSGALAGDQAVLRGTDPEFDPKTALATLTGQMSGSEIAAAKARLKKSPAPSASPPTQSAQPPSASPAPAPAAAPQSPAAKG